jgi:Protein of unknown function (DUF3108)
VPRVLIALGLAAVLAPSPGLAAGPRPYRAEYDVLRNGAPLGRATVTFSAQPNGGYELRSATRGTEGIAAIAGVSIDEVSTLRLVGGRLETVNYSYQQKLAFKSKDRTVRVDAAAGRITSLDKGQSTMFKYQPGVLDRNAVTAALVQDLAANRSGDLTYPVVDRESVMLQRYRPAATEALATSMGKLRAVRLERIRDSGDGRTTTLWLGADRGFVPLKIVQTEANGETIEMRATAIR